jgi:hypothetical protein
MRLAILGNGVEIFEIPDLVCSGMLKAMKETVGSASQNRRISRVVSVCEARDIHVWSIASARIIRFISANSYHIICPDSEVGVFMEASAPGWEVMGERNIGGEDCLRLVRQGVCGENLKRVHWLYQQFLKINAIRGSKLGDEDIMLIWDADTIPLRRLDFVEAIDGRLVYYHGREHHVPYFHTIMRLLGYEREAGISFIAQCMPLRVGWVREMLEDIESRFGVRYEEAVLGLLPGVSGSEFSEYETLGAWVWRHHRDEILIRRRNRWLRSGSRWFGKDLNSIKSGLLFCLLALHYDYVAVEKWCRPVTPKRVFDYMKRRFFRQGAYTRED